MSSLTAVRYEAAPSAASPARASWRKARAMLGSAAARAGAFLAAASAFYWGTVVPVLAQTTTGDPKAPLTFFSTARSDASSSQLNMANVTTYGTNFTTIIVIAMAVTGLGTCSVSGYQLYSNVNAGEQARGSNFTYGIAFIVGAALTVVGVIVGVISNVITT